MAAAHQEYRNLSKPHRQDKEMDIERAAGGDDQYGASALDLNHEYPASPKTLEAASHGHGHGHGGGGGGGGRRKKSSKKRAPPLPPIRASSNPKAIFNLPPLKIIKASVGYQGISIYESLLIVHHPNIYEISYIGTKQGELSFEKGEFFYVIGDKRELEQYEVMNPLEKSRGIVHYRHFKNIARNAAEERAQQEELSRELNGATATTATGGKSKVDDYFHGLSLGGGGGPKSAPPIENGSRGDHQMRNGWSDDETDYDPKRPASRYDDAALQDYYDQDFFTNDVVADILPLDLVVAEEEEDAYYRDKAPPATSTFTKNLPTPTRTTNPKNFKKGPKDLESCLVHSTSLSKDKWYFVLHIKYMSGHLDILRRSYDEIWALQVTLLTRFPQYSGHASTPRLIPFLTPPQPGLSREDAKQEMNRYFRQLDSLPPSLLQNPHISKFFAPKIGDLANTSLSSSAEIPDVADTLFELLEDITAPPSQVTIKLVVGKDIIAWKEDVVGFGYEELLWQVQDRLGFDLERREQLVYCDETNSMVPLYGDEDLQLLISCSPKLKFYLN